MKILIVCVILTLTVVRAEYPSNLTRCPINDKICLVKAAQEYTEKYYAGLPEINLQPFDPLHVKSMVLERNPSSPVNIEIKFTDLNLIGLKSTKIQSVTASDIGGRFELVGLAPDLSLKGKYNIDGRVLILPIVGDGTTEIKCKNVNFKYSFDLKPVEKNGQTYAALEHVKLELKPELVQFHFDNLFNGDKALGDNMNQFINENWSDIFKEIKPSFSKALALVVKSMLNKFFGKYPYAEYFQ